MFKSLSFKVFIISFLIQIVTGALICTILYSKTPAHSARGELADLVLQLGDSSREEAGILIDEFIERTDIDIAVYRDPDLMGSFNMFDDSQLLTDFGTKTLKSVSEVRKAYDATGDGFFRIKKTGMTTFTDHDVTNVLQHTC